MNKPGITIKRGWWVAGLLLVLALGFFWWLVLAPQGFVYPATGVYSDLTITHWPNAWFVRYSLATWGQVPLWRHLILGGAPFASNPLSGLWYLPHVLLLILPLALGFNVLFLLHTVWAGCGGYVLARSMGASRWGAGVAALTVMFAPKAIAHLGAGHVGLYEAWAWVPWLVWSVRRLVTRGRLVDVAPAALAAALMALADVRMGIYGGVTAAVYGVWLMLRPRGDGVQKGRLWGMAVLAGLLAVALVAVQFVPLAAVVGRLNRGGMDVAESATPSLPPRYLLGLLVADDGGFQETMTYVGVVGLLLAVVALFRWRSSERWLWAGGAVTAAVYALGIYTPLYAWLYGWLWPLRWLRGPARAWFVVALAVAVLGAQGLTTLEGALSRRRRDHLVAVALGMAALAGGVGGVILHLPVNVIVAAVIWPLAGAVLSVRGWLGRRFFPGVVLALTLADLWLVGFTLYRVRPPEDVFTEGQVAAVWLAEQPGRFRVYSPSYSIPQHTGAVYGIELVDGVDPFQVADYVAFMRTATGVDVPGYSVTVPPFTEVAEGADMLLAHRDVVPDAQRLGVLNVRYVAAAFPIAGEEWVPRGMFDGVYIYENEHVLPRAFVVDPTVPADAWTAEMVAAATVLDWTPNRIVVEADGPGVLVLSEVYDPDWRVGVDGGAVEMERVGDILRGVYLDDGPHQVVFDYWPAGLTVGLVVTSLAGVGVLLLWVVGRKRKG